MDLSLYNNNFCSVRKPSNIRQLKIMLQKSSDVVLIAGGRTNVYGMLSCDVSNTVIDMTKLNNKICKFVYESGIMLSKINDDLKGDNLELPVNIMNNKNASLGGSFVSNSFGYGTYKYGFFRDNVEEYWVLEGGTEIKKTVVQKTTLEKIKSLNCDVDWGVITKIKITPIKKIKTFNYAYKYSRKMLELIKNNNYDGDIRTILIFGCKSFCFWGINHRIIYMEDEGCSFFEKNKSDISISEFISRGKFAVPKNIKGPRVEMSFIVEKINELERLMDFVDDDADTNFLVTVHKEFFIVTLLFIKNEKTKNVCFEWIDKYKKMVRSNPKFRFGKIFI